MIANISYYESIRDTKGNGTLPIDFFLEGIKTGKWQNQVIDYRAAVEKYGKESKSAKDTKLLAPAVTISGEFSERRVKGLIKHSGFIVADIDNLDDPEETKRQLSGDRFVYAVFYSIGGKGLCIIIKIDPRRHLDAFNGISEYLFTTYNIIVDSSGKDVSRARFVSYDPDIFINEGSAKFTIYPKPKPKALRKLSKVIFVRSDFDEIILQLENRSIDIVNDYQMWLAVAFGLADKFADGGREYFHRISRISSKYDSRQCDRQYDVCLKHNGDGITIATLYYLCKQAGIQTISKETKLIATTATQAKKGGRSLKDAVKLLKDVEGIQEIESAPIVQQVFENDIDFKSDDGFIFELESWLRQNYDLRLNVLTRKIEESSVPMELRQINSVFLAGKKIFDKELNFDLMDRLIHSDFVPEFNPLLNWIEENKDRRTEGNIDKLCASIKTNMEQRYVVTFVTKWLLGIIESIHGESSPLMLVLAGERQGTGKTEWFRRLLPREIRQYYAESKLDKGNDDEILMTQKLIIMDDEMAGKSKRDSLKMKYLTSKKYFSLREPYGRANVDLKRLAMLAGTSNDTGLLSDPTGNRRILPVYVSDIDKELYNSIDKAELLIEVYWLWKENGFTSQLSREEIEYLNSQTEDFESVSMERELIQRFFLPPDGTGTFMTTTDVKVRLESGTGQKLVLNRIGQELKALGYEYVAKKISGKTQRGYYMSERVGVTVNTEGDGLPF